MGSSTALETLWGFSQLVGSWEEQTLESRNLHHSLPKRSRPEICCDTLLRCETLHLDSSDHSHCTTSRPYGSGHSCLKMGSIKPENKIRTWKWLHHDQDKTASCIQLVIAHHWKHPCPGRVWWIVFRCCCWGSLQHCPGRCPTSVDSLDFLIPSGNCCTLHKPSFLPSLPALSSAYSRPVWTGCKYFRAQASAHRQCCQSLSVGTKTEMYFIWGFCTNVSV